MGAAKNYLLEVITACIPDEDFGQDAIEYAIIVGLIVLAYDNEHDIRNIMSRYSEIVEAYQKEINRNQAMLVETYGPLFTEIERRIV